MARRREHWPFHRVLCAVCCCAVFVVCIEMFAPVTLPRTMYCPFIQPTHALTLPRTMYCPFIQPTHALAHRSQCAMSRIRTGLPSAHTWLLHVICTIHHLQHTTTHLTAASPLAAAPPPGPFFSLPIFSLGFQATRHHWNYHTIGQKNLTMQGAHWEHGEGYVPLRCVVAVHRCCACWSCAALYSAGS